MKMDRGRKPLAAEAAMPAQRDGGTRLRGWRAGLERELDAARGARAIVAAVIALALLALATAETGPVKVELASAVEARAVAATDARSE